MLRKTESQPGAAGQLRGLRPEERLWAVLGVMAPTLLPPPPEQRLPPAILAHALLVDTPCYLTLGLS